MFPGPGAQIYRNEVGEVTGWDYPSEDEPYFDDFEDDREILPLCDVCGYEIEGDTCEICTEEA